MLNNKKNIQLLINTFKKFNNKTLINHISTKKKITYASFLDRSFEFLNFLKLKKKLKEGDRVIIKNKDSLRKTRMKKDPYTKLSNF